MIGQLCGQFFTDTRHRSIDTKMLRMKTKSRIRRCATIGQREVDTSLDGGIY